MTPAPDFVLSDIFYDMLDLSALIETILLTVSEMEFVRADGSRNEELDRAHAMLRLASREAKRQSEAALVLDGSPSMVLDQLRKEGRDV